jgi:hypothetical protein
MPIYPWNNNLQNQNTQIGKKKTKQTNTFSKKNLEKEKLESTQLKVAQARLGYQESTWSNHKGLCKPYDFRTIQDANPSPSGVALCFAKF